MECKPGASRASYSRALACDAGLSQHQSPLAIQRHGWPTHATQLPNGGLLCPPCTTRVRRPDFLEQAFAMHSGSVTRDGGRSQYVDLTYHDGLLQRSTQAGEPGSAAKASATRCVELPSSTSANADDVDALFARAVGAGLTAAASSWNPCRGDRYRTVADSNDDRRVRASAARRRRIRTT